MIITHRVAKPLGLPSSPHTTYATHSNSPLKQSIHSQPLALAVFFIVVPQRTSQVRFSSVILLIPRTRYGCTVNYTPHTKDTLRVGDPPSQ